MNITHQCRNTGLNQYNAVMQWCWHRFVATLKTQTGDQMEWRPKRDVKCFAKEPYLRKHQHEFKT